MQLSIANHIILTLCLDSFLVYGNFGAGPWLHEVKLTQRKR